MAVVDGERRLRYREWDALVDRLAGGLALAGVGPGDHVAILARNSLEQVSTHMAVSRLGAVMVMLNYRFSAAELRALLVLTAPKVLVVDGELATVVAEVMDEIPSLARVYAIGDAGPIDAAPWQELTEAAHLAPVVDLSPDAPAMMMFTSGTTALPKAVVITRRAEWNNAWLLVSEFGLRPGARTLHLAPLFHAAAWDCFFVPHVAMGGVNVMMRTFDSEHARRIVEGEGIQSTMFVPTHIHLAREHGGGWASHGPSASLSFVAVTGAPVQRDALTWLEERVCSRVFNIYGLTEATTLITLCPPEESARFTEMPCIGRPLLGMETRLVSLDAEQPSPDDVVEPGQHGQLICRGPKLMAGYYQNPEATAGRLVEGWLYTGDVCVADQDGFHYITDRVDDLILTGGENVYPVEVSTVLERHPDIAECFVMGVQDDKWGQRIKAFVVPACDGLAVEDIQAWLVSDGRLSTFKRPREIEIVREIPRNASGKVLRRALLARDAAAEPATPAEGDR